MTDSGEGKTPAQRVAVDPIIQRQATSDDLYEKKKKEADEIWNSWNERRKNFKDVNKGKSEFIEPEPERISKRPPIFWICDTTIEALFAVLKYNPRGIIDVLDELSSLINSMNQYKGGKGNDREIWLSLWNGGAISIARKGSRAGDGLEVTTLKQTCVNVTGGIQPCKISALIGDKPGESTDGFAQRFLLSYPDCCPQFYQETGGIPEELTRNYRALVDKLFEYGETYFIDQVLTLTPEANKLWIDLFNSFMRDKIKNPDLPSVLKETWAKMPTQTLRIALVLHVTRMVSEDGVGDEVDETSMSMAILLTNYFKAHIKKVYREAMKMKGGKEESNNFRKIINTIANSQQIKLTLRDVQRNCNIQNSKIAKIILNEMIEKEILIKEESGKKEYYTFSKRYLEEGSF
ncbi:MAG TPA: DUF3987 domain-containing protein [Clostridia bacterium]|nr:DUF3987 domain-containing protein [Clostridia bacterium]